ncbi:MAG: UTP--glucose-1-phosphate uridylyltransferase GalU [Kiloniellales bacterium]
MATPLRKAVFPVGGLGTRFLPATKALPKEMLPVVDKPLIQYAVEEARAAGFEELIFVTGRGKTAIEDHFDHNGELQRVLEARGRGDESTAMQDLVGGAGSVSYTRQPEPLGLGHAVWCARHLIGAEPFAVLLADDLIQSDSPCLSQMVEAYAETGGNLIAAMEVPAEETSRYGIIDPASTRGRIVKAKGIVEKPKPAAAPSRLAVVGRYILQPQVLDELGRQEAGAGGEIQLTDAIARTLGQVPLAGYRFEGRRFDCGNKVGFLDANLAYALARDDLGAEAAEIVRRYAAELGLVPQRGSAAR